MLQGLRTGASAMLAGMERVDIISHNLANSATPGFKKTKTTMRAFADMVAKAKEAIAEREDQPISDYPVNTRVDGTWLVLEQGPFRATAGDLDVAINGEAFFAVETPEGERYTRDGRFRLDSTGTLVTAAGFPVLGQGGPIRVQGSDAAINQNGEVLVAGKVVDRLRLVGFSNASAVSREGGNLYRANEASGEPEAVECDLLPGHYEESNVNVVAEMTELILATRYYEASQRVITAQDDTLAKLVNEVGRV